MAHQTRSADKSDVLHVRLCCVVKEKSILEEMARPGCRLSSPGAPRPWLTWCMHLTVSSPVQSLADIHRIEATPLTQTIPWASTYALIRASAQVHAEQPALTFLHTGQPGGPSTTWTYRSLLQGIHQTANALHSLHIGPQDVVAILLPGGLAYHLALWGGEAAGIVQPLNPLLSEEKLLLRRFRVCGRFLPTLSARLRNCVLGYLSTCFSFGAGQLAGQGFRFVVGWD